LPTPISYFLPSLPEGLEGLTDLALDLRWSWNHAADKLWRKIDPELWEKTGNPWLILQTIAATRLEALAADIEFRKMVEESAADHSRQSAAQTWFELAYPRRPFDIAYFSMEYGLSEALPIYSGGLGILAGDYLKTASDLGVPVVGLGLLYQLGYFRQVLDSHGDQTEFYPYNDPSQLPVVPTRDRDGEWLRIRIDLPGRALWVRCWEAIVGRVKLYLLDSNDPENYPPDRGITGELYGGGPETRLQQEIVLGIGGWRVIAALGIQPKICHLNEGHAAFAVLERARSFMLQSRQPFDVALAATRPGNVFTSHTPVEAGFDRFSPDLVHKYLAEYAAQIGIGIDAVMAMGRQNSANPQEPMNMAFLAVRGSGMVNGVSRLHGEVSRRIFQSLFPRWPRSEVPVTHVTNGVHVATWDSAAADEVWTGACGKARWLSTTDSVAEDFMKVSDDSLWTLRMSETRELLLYVRERLRRQLLAAGTPSELGESCGRLLDPNALTIGFARRFTDYKRPNLLLNDPERLGRILNHGQRPVQLIIAGKAHPRDDDGKALVREWWEFSTRPEVRERVVFLADYDMNLAEHLIQGVDLWINTPRRPWEACGTSGMKVLVNGGLNLSELDGWWSEAYQPDAGWAIGDGLEHDGDPNWDSEEARQLYRLLEEEIVPCFYARDDQGIPKSWVASMRASMARLVPQFSANRMMREYVDKMYAPCARRYRRRIDSACQEAIRLSKWQRALEDDWHKLRFGEMNLEDRDGVQLLAVTVYADDLGPESIGVELYAEPLGDEPPDIRVMKTTGPVPGAVNGYRYVTDVPPGRPLDDYTPRIIPRFDGAAIPLEANQILWFER
jgi:starch phosphorylase